jgi:iron complex transport system substrate-binding protein
MITTFNTMSAKLAKIAKPQTIGLFFFVIVAIFAGIVTRSSARDTAHATAQPTPARIISLIPAVSEMLFALGAGPQVVAVSSFDDYPPDVLTLPRVGALLDPDLERILSLRPDLVIVYESQVDLRRQLERATIPMFVYKHAGLADVTTTLRQLGARIGRDADAGALAHRIDAALADVRTRVAGRPRPRTLLIVGRDALTLRGIYASGGFGFLHDMLGAAGGDNVFADLRQESVQATSELILARGPDVILELRADDVTPEQQRKEIAVWQVLPSVPAVRTGRVAIIADPRTVVPGPRVAEGTELIARVLHPEAFANEKTAVGVGGARQRQRVQHVVSVISLVSSRLTDASPWWRSRPDTGRSARSTGILAGSSNLW